MRYEAAENHMPTAPSRQADEALDRLIDYAGWATTPKPHKDAVATVRDELGRLRGEVVEWRTSIATEKLTWRAEAAEAEVQRLREGLRRIANRYCLHTKGDSQQESACLDKPSEQRCSVCIARALLSASPSDGGGAK